MKKLSTIQDVRIGCDPEFFFRQDGEIIGSEKIIPEDGLSLPTGGKFVRDGVQAEMNPSNSHCRGTMNYQIRDLFKLLKNRMGEFSGVTADFSVVVEVSKKKMATLGIKSQVFGCAESKNVHLKTLNKISKISVDPKVYMKRSAGGHIHLGVPESRNIWVETGQMKTSAFGTYKDKKMITLPFKPARDPDIIIPLLDIIVGNTLVLLDRDEDNIERRKVYGRAGEFREPKHGIEYRTPSNFWLRAPELSSLIFGLCRQAVQIAVESDKDNPIADELIKMVNMSDIEKAINKNDYDLALRNWRKIEDFLMSITPESGFYPITPNTLKAFNHFHATGLDKWFPRDPFANWAKVVNEEAQGFNYFLKNVVAPKLPKTVTK